MLPDGPDYGRFELLVVGTVFASPLSVVLPVVAAPVVGRAARLL